MLGISCLSKFILFEKLRAILSSPAFVVTLCAAILFYRTPDAFLNPQFYCEDGFAYFATAHERGFQSIFANHAGYVQLIPALLASIVNLFTVRYAPHCCSYAALAIGVATVAYIFSRRIRLNFKPLLCLSVALAPCLYNEVYGNMTNCQWFLALMLVLLAVSDDAVTRGQYAFDLVVLFFAGMTGPFIVAFIPLFAWRAWLRRSRASKLLLAGACVLAALQAALMVFRPWNRPGGFEHVPFANPFSQDWVKFIGQGVAGIMVFGPRAALAQSSVPILFAVSMALLAALSFDTLRSRDHTRAVFLASAALVTASAIYSWKGRLGLLVPACRYSFCPIVLLYWTMIQSLSRARWLAAPSLLLLLCSAAAVMPDLSLPAQPDMHWAVSSQLVDSPGSVRLPIIPFGDMVDLDNPDVPQTRIGEEKLPLEGRQEWPGGDESRRIQLVINPPQYASGIRLTYTLKSNAGGKVKVLARWSGERKYTRPELAGYTPLTLIADGQPHKQTFPIGKVLCVLYLDFEDPVTYAKISEVVRLAPEGKRP